MRFAGSSRALGWIHPCTCSIRRRVRATEVQVRHIHSIHKTKVVLSTLQVKSSLSREETPMTGGSGPFRFLGLPLNRTSYPFLSGF